MVILAAGLTPAWQQILSFDAVHLGEVNRAEEVLGCASGKVLNVGSAVHHLGLPSLTLCPVGGLTGRQIQADFAQLQIPATWLDTATATRVCTTILDRATDRTTELVENSAPLSSVELDQFADAFAAAARQAEIVVLSGSLPHQTPRDFYAQLMSQTSARVLLDARGPELQAALPHRPWLVKPNREELAQTLGRPLDTPDALVAGIRELLAAGAQHVVVSDGAGALYAADPGGVQVIPALKVRTVNPIGCGDCLAAGLAVAAFEGRPWNDVLAFGIATAAENASRLLPARFPRAAVEQRLLRLA